MAHKARISLSSSTVVDDFAVAKMRSTMASVTGRPRRSSQKMTFDLPDIGPTSISCSRPTRLAGTPEYTASTSARSFFLKALITAAAWTPVAVRNASLPDDRVVRRNRHAGRGRHRLAVLDERRQIALDVPHQHQVHEQHVHRRVADALADADAGAVEPRRAGVERGQRVDDGEIAVAVAVPVDADAAAALLDDLRDEPDDGRSPDRRRVADGVGDADAASPRRGSRSSTAGAASRARRASCPR